MKINSAFVTSVLCSFIREEVARFGMAGGIIGLSGGLDSTVSAFLAAGALGPKKVLGVIMPYGDTFPQDVADARAVVRRLGIRSRVINIAPMVDAYFSRYPTSSRRRSGNKMARERMSVLYDISAEENAMVLGTSNKTELLIGYGTIHGDMACGINPLGDLYKTQVRELAAHLGVSRRILEKQPTAGLWPGQTDEGEIGLTYEEIDAVLFKLVDLQVSAEDIAAAGVRKKTVVRIAALIRNSEFKRKMPPVAKLSARTVGLDFLYPYDRNR
jgi:NAD+ synthase